MITYVTTYHCGFGDDNYFGNLYAGADYNQAVKTITEFIFPDDSSQWGNIEFWENGKIIRNREFEGGIGFWVE